MDKRSSKKNAKHGLARLLRAFNSADVGKKINSLGFSYSQEQTEALAVYLDLLQQWNSRMNLTGFKTWELILNNLVVDSFWLDRFIQQNQFELDDNSQTWDLGAGAGLPGIPLRILWNRGQYWLVEAREKRALFLAYVLTKLILPGTKNLWGRAEDFVVGKKADLIISRAFMPWPAVLKLVEPHLVDKGRVLFLTNAPLSPSLPWHAHKTQTYSVAGKTRFICLLTRCEV